METWEDAQQRLLNGTDCRHEGVDCEVVLVCKEGCTCATCRETASGVEEMMGKDNVLLPSHRRDAAGNLLRQWRRDNDAMFSEPEDDEAWNELCKQLMGGLQ